MIPLNDTSRATDQIQKLLKEEQKIQKKIELIRSQRLEREKSQSPKELANTQPLKDAKKGDEKKDSKVKNEKIDEKKPE